MPLIKTARFNKSLVLGFVLLVSFLPVRKGYAVIGSENIDEETIYRFRREHESMIDDERKQKEDAQTLEQLRIAEEKKRALLEGKGVGQTEKEKQLSAEESKKLAKEISRLQIELVPKKKRWRDRIHISPFSEVTYDSNLLHQPRHSEKPDVYFVNGGVAEVDLGTKKTQVDLKYRGGYYKYTNQGKYDRFEQRFGTELGHRFSSKTNATAYYRLFRGAEQTSEIRTFDKRLQQEVGGGLNYRLSRKTGVRLRTDYVRTEFIKPETKSNSSDQIKVGPEIHYFLTDKTSLFALYEFGSSGGGANDSNKAISNDIRGGIRGKIAPKTSALIDLGASRQENRGGLHGHNTIFSGQMIVITDLTPKTRAEAFMNRSMTQAVQTQGANFYVTTNFGLRFATKFTRRFIGQLELSLRRNSFDVNGSLSQSNQHDTIFQNLFRLQYEIQKYLLVGLQYNLDAANSNVKTSEYVGHRVSVDLTGRF